VASRAVNKDGLEGLAVTRLDGERRRYSGFSAKQVWDSRRMLLNSWRAGQAGQALARFGVQRVEFEEEQVNLASTFRTLHFLKQFGELNVNGLAPTIQLDGYLEVLDSLFVVLRNCG
jgi:hypothetical protein